MDLLTSEPQHLGITNLNDLLHYHLQFITITTWLIKKKWLGDLEQQQAYIWAFQLLLLNTIMQHLQLKDPDHHPNIPYKIQDIYEAACFNYLLYHHQYLLSGIRTPQMTQQSNNQNRTDKCNIFRIH